MQSVILSCGDELTSGATLDTNSAWLSQHLADRGIEVLRHETVGDSEELIAESISRATGVAELLIITGGLGPTRDDLTRQALARAMGATLEEDPQSLQQIATWFTARDRVMTASNRMQALVPKGASAIENHCGTAPGLSAIVGRCQVYVLPGPPHEMIDMFTRSVCPHLATAGLIARRVIHTFGAGESHIGEVLGDLMARGRNPRVGTTASGGLVSVRILAHGGRTEVAQALADADEQEVRTRLGDLVFGGDDETMALVLGRQLQAARQSVAVAESCTGGMIGEMLTAIAGSSEYFLGGVVAYANQAKTELLGVSKELLAAHGAVSEPVAQAMAEGARTRFRSDWALSVTGIAGPGGGSADKPVGLVYIGLAGPDGYSMVHKSSFPGSRQQIRLRAALAAMNHLRLAMKKS